MANTVDPDEMAHYESGSTVFANSAFVVFGPLRIMRNGSKCSISVSGKYDSNKELLYFATSKRPEAKQMYKFQVSQSYLSIQKCIILLLKTRKKRAAS